ncbi:hypothetical protein CHLNCDRAFT_58355 [Chlorella variabilis]|uniref:Structural maintenance of chromosomes protein 5 n=1 Tax=Chlorella variabilis TaxID=554065 RepID=E1ZJJ7_CHLVA|nr:hypothetical protein CHLNCDRAFT_58355 [Chlorella variabilis]EFN54004.1 hypothetical protein CHLNCDRAFT_58355 [Chlorella variabilis]|eukprot:XP_005846106.1 hypothetical protein CHLNCDRAFT_58355 [Chlorella variabilis]
MSPPLPCSAYPTGSVMRVEVSNFMTYKRATVEPGPKLNLVLGPNGTGKSSLVCAICVGLAGRTSLLGRAEDVSSFVRRGASAGWVEITLSSGNPMRPHVVRREMHRDTNSSEWYINREKVRMKDVEELVRDKLKVQLDNLCQFLPQDKVVEFARMTPKDLLEATEKAIGNGELYEQHSQLIKVRRELAGHDQHKAALDESVAQLKADNSRSTRDVQNIQRRQQLMEEVELARQKLPWVVFEGRRKAWEKDKELRDSAKRRLQERQQAQQGDEGPLAARQQLLERLRAKKKVLDAELKEADQKLAGGPAARGRDPQPGLEDEMNAALEEITAKQAEIQGLATAAAARERKVAELEAALAGLEEAVAGLPPLGDTGELGAQRQQLQKESHDIAMQASAPLLVSSLNMQVEELQGSLEAVQRRRRLAEDKLRRIDDSKMRRLQALDQRYRGIAAVWRYLQANRARFKYPVYGPIALEVECPDPLHVRCLEQQVAANVWSFFVTQHKDDHDLLEEECKRFNFRPSVACYKGDPHEPIRHPRGEASEYARYGISQTLDCVFVAPPVVKRVLCDEARIHEAYVGDRGTRVEELFRDHDRLQQVYTPDCSYRRAVVGGGGVAAVRTRSAYNSTAESTLVGDLRPARLLSGAATVDDGREREAAQADMQACDQEAAGLQGEMRELQEQRQAKQHHLDGLKRQQARIADQERVLVERHRSMRTKLKSKQSELERLRRQPGPRKKEPRLRALEMAEVQAGQAERLLGSAATDLGIREAAMQVEHLAQASQRRQAQLRDLQSQVDRLTTLCRISAEECRQGCGAAVPARLRRPAARAANRLLDYTSQLCNQGWPGRLAPGLPAYRPLLAPPDAAGPNAAGPALPARRKLKDRAEQAAPMSDELAAAWEAAALPDEEAGLQDLIAEKTAESDGMLVQNPAALRQYNERCRQIAEQERQLAELEEKRQLARQTIDDVTSRWLPALQRIVSTVNATFSANFRTVGCAGDVVLHEAPDEDFEHYAIEIRVKFRDSEELQTLDANRQSGGERSVSTILYLIALQGVTVTPFRVVDEINQGMDPINERKVFMQLVDAACRTGTPQCFLLTPKLLPDLPFTRDVTVLQIMNGNHIKDVAVGFKMESLLGSQRAALLVAA